MTIKKHIDKTLAKNSLLLVASGVSLSLPFIRPWLGWYSLICMLPFLFLLQNLLESRRSNKTVIKYVWLVGMLAMAIVVSWMFQLNATGLLEDKLTRFIFLPFTLVLMVFIFSSGYLLFGYFYTKLKINLNKPSSYILLPALWIVCEFFRSVIFSVCMLGEGGAVGMHWNFGVLGLGAVSTPLVFASRFFGMFGLGFLVVLINLAIFQIIRRRFRLISLTIIITISLISLLGYFIYGHAATSGEKVGIVHLGADDDWDYQSKLQQKINSSNQSKVNLVIFPEYSHIFEEPKYLESDKNLIDSIITNDRGRIITTKSINTEEGETNAIILLDKDNHEYSRQGKTFLIPGGEYIPYFYKAIIFASGNNELINNHESKYTVYQSKTPIAPIDVDGTKYGVLACSGIIAPEFYRDLANKGASVLVNSASLSTMGMGDEFFYQADQMARFQAVANNKYLVQSARGKKSYIMSNDGGVVSSNSTINTNYFVGNVKPVKSKTMYTVLGEWVVGVGLLGIGAYLIYLNRKILNKIRRFDRFKR